MATIPALSSIDKADGKDDDIVNTAATQRGPGPILALDHPQVLNPIDNVGEASAHDDIDPKASVNATFNSQLGEDLCTHAHGKVEMGSTAQSSTDEDLFASSSEGKSPVK